MGANRVISLVLPSTAIARLPAGMSAAGLLASHALITVVSRSGSRACSNRRIIASDGRRSAAMPKAWTVASGTSATHSAIAAYERYPAHPGAHRRGHHHAELVSDTATGS
jgi:hypothetical protein